MSAEAIGRFVPEAGTLDDLAAEQMSGGRQLPVAVVTGAVETPHKLARLRFLSRDRSS